MTPLAAVLLVVALLAAVANWASRRTGNRPLEWATKPTVTALVALAAAVCDPVSDAMRWWFVAGFVACLVGDVLLMVPRERFVEGLGAFLVAHLAFAVGFVAGGLHEPLVALLTAVAVVGLLADIGLRVLAGATRKSLSLRAPVAVYLLVLGVMTVLAGWHGAVVGLAGAAAFVVSDSMLGWDKFVQPLPWAPVGVMVTYHAALLGLFLALV
jgi:uncharacterized membrane protein YhhN